MEHPRATATPARRFTKGEKKMLIGSIMLAALLILGGAWYRWMNADPVLQIPTPTLPKPNAFDFYVQAGQAAVNKWAPVDFELDARRSGPISPQELARRYPTAAKEAWLRKNAKTLQLLRQGFHYRYLQPPMRSFRAPTPPYSQFRYLARMLMVESHARAERGDWAGAAESACDIMRLGNDVPRGSPLLGASVGYSIQAWGRRELWNITPHLNAIETQKLTQRLEDLMGQSVSYADTLQEEKWLGQANLIEMFHQSNWRQQIAEVHVWSRLRNNSVAARMQGTQSSRLQQWKIAAEGWGVTGQLVFRSKRSIMKHYTQIMDALIASARRSYSKAPPLPIANDPLTEQAKSVFGRSRWSTARNESSNALLLAALALHAYQLEHGMYPAQLSALVPRYLKRIPSDPFGKGESLRYRRTNKTHVLWSIGPDGVDNGGRAIDRAPRANKETIPRRTILPDGIGDVVAGINKWN